MTPQAVAYRLSHRLGDESVVSSLHCMNDPQPEGHMASYIGRRKFLATLGGAAVAWPLAARAQARRPLVGYLAGAASASVMRGTTAPAFFNGLREQGYIEGRDLDIAYKFADGFLDRLPALAEQLVRLRPDAILAPTTPSALAARAASATVPIVCPLLEDPVRTGLVASENRPGGNVIGLLRYVDGLAG